MTNLPIKGLDETLAVLDAFPKKMVVSAIRQGLTAAARPVRDEARMRAPKKSGLMAKSIRSGSARKNKDGTYQISIRLTGNNHAFLGLFFEYGVRPHYITAGEGDLSARKLTQKVRREGGDDAMLINGNYVKGQILHPGISARPFLRPALDVKAEEAIQAFAKKIKDYVDKYTGFKAAA